MDKQLVKYATVDELFQEVEATDNSVHLEGFLERENDGQVKVAVFGDCKRWISLPSGSISDIEVIRRHAPCITEAEGYHTHAYAAFSVDATDADAARALARFAITLAMDRPRGANQPDASSPGIRVPAPQLARGARGTPARRPGLGQNIFPLLMQQRAAGGYRPMDYVCEYNTICDPACVCVDYQNSHAYCCDCCIA